MATESCADYPVCHAPDWLGEYLEQLKTRDWKKPRYLYVKNNQGGWDMIQIPLREGDVLPKKLKEAFTRLLEEEKG